MESNGNGNKAPTVKYVAKQFLKLFADEKRWTDGPMARDKDGRETLPGDESAVSFCIGGAVARALLHAEKYGDHQLWSAVERFQTLLDVKAHSLYGTSATGVNEQMGLDELRGIIENVRDGATA